MESSRQNTIASSGESLKGSVSSQNLDFTAIKENFYNNLEESDTLIDYFCIVGIDQIRVQQIAAAKGTLPPEIIAKEL